MSATREADWRHRTRTPVLVATGLVWLATVEVAALQTSGAEMAMPTSEAHPDLTMAGLMTLAMMAPFLIEPVRHGLARSLRRRRLRATVLLVAAHLVVWVAAGVLLQVAGAWLLAHLGPAAAVTAGVVLAVGWHLAPVTQRLANRHHAHPPLAAFGRAADRDLLRYGVRHAASCLGACWTVMLLPVLLPAHVVAVTTLGSLWVWAMSLESPDTPRWRLRRPRRAARRVGGRVRILLRTVARARRSPQVVRADTVVLNAPTFPELSTARTLK
jgi:predicted metal-binding membrane protein